MTINSVWYAFLITFFTLIISYPTAYFLTKLKHKQLWLMLIILPTWVNLLLKLTHLLESLVFTEASTTFLTF